MNIFYKRPLSLILCVMLGGFLFSAHASLGAKVLLATLTALLSVPLLILRRKYKINFTVFIAIICLLLSTLFGHLYFEGFDPSKKYSDEAKIEGVVTHVDSSSDYTTGVYVDTESINGKAENHSILLRLAKRDALNIRVGAEIQLYATLRPIKSSEDFDARSYYYSLGISATTDEYRDLCVLGDSNSAALRLSLWNDTVSRHSVLVMGEDAGGFFSAVFMGNRSYLSPDLKLDFQRIGISHVLALSGMHLAILSLGIEKLLSLFGVRKKPRLVILILFTVFYVALTGFSVSVLRAGIMLIISSLLFLLASMRDMPTNLSLSVFLICLFQPYAIFDVSLWLSAFATLGIIIMSEAFEKRKKTTSLPLRFLLWVFTSFVASFFAISATMAITAAFCGTLSLMSFFATLIISLFVEIFIYIGLAVLLFGTFIPIGRYVMMPFIFMIEKTSAVLSYPKLVLLSADESVTSILVAVFTVSFFAFVILKFKRKKPVLLVILSLFIAVHISMTVYTCHSIYTDDVIYESNEDHDLFIVKSNGKSAALDVAKYKESTAYDTLSALKRQNIFTLDTYVISHYSYGLENALETLLSGMKIRSVLLPTPTCDDEKLIFEIVKNQLLRHKTEIKTYAVNETLGVGEYKITARFCSEYGSDGTRLAFSIRGDRAAVAYLSSGMLHYKTRKLAEEISVCSDAVVYGAFGKKYFPTYYLNKEYHSKRLLVISGDDIYLTQDALKFLNENSTEVLAHPGTVSLIDK